MKKREYLKKRTEYLELTAKLSREIKKKTPSASLIDELNSKLNDLIVELTLYLIDLPKNNTKQN